jgi:tetratricopeptide (TPR) repeat protein
VLWRRLLVSLPFFLLAQPAQTATILVIRFHNESQYADLNWVGESVSETLRSEFNQADQIVLDHDATAQGMDRLALRSDALFTKATLIRLGRSLDADFVIYGTFEPKPTPGSSQLKDSSIILAAQFLDLRKLKDGPGISETGKLTDLSRLEEHLAWVALKYLDPGVTFNLDNFLAPQKLKHLDADESYIRGLLSGNADQQQKWFLQAATLDARFTSPAYELGKLYLQRKDYRQALRWLGHIAPGDPRYADARFRMGLSAYSAADYTTAGNYFREVAKIIPLNEVYNNLAAAEDQLNQPAALDDYRRALSGDPNDPIYLFNLGAALLRQNSYAEAVQRLEAAAGRLPDDSEVGSLLERARARQPAASGAKPLAPARLKPNLDATAYRQLKAMLQPKTGP